MACVRMYRGSWVVDYRDAQGKRHIESAGVPGNTRPGNPGRDLSIGAATQRIGTLRAWRQHGPFVTVHLWKFSLTFPLHLLS
jgi:hypothetical protein